jgi:GNAT superfamily N-acetyltransferase
MSNDKSVVNMFHVEKMTPADFAFAVQLANTMEWNMTSGDFEFNATLEPEGCFTLFDGAEHVGLATCISYGRVGWFGNLIKPKYRRKGAGTLLVKHAVSYLQSVGVKTVGLYAYSHLIPFYSQLGFKDNAEFVVLKAGKVASATEEEKMKAASKQDIPTLVELDSRCFGACRQRLLESILLYGENLCQVAVEEGELVGFAAAKIYGKMAEVGPLVCRINRSDIADKLLKSVLWRLQSREAFMCLPSADAALIEVAAKTGFAEEFRVARMFLGSLSPQNCIYVAESLERG